MSQSKDHNTAFSYLIIALVIAFKAFHSSSQGGASRSPTPQLQTSASGSATHQLQTSDSGNSDALLAADELLVSAKPSMKPTELRSLADRAIEIYKSNSGSPLQLAKARHLVGQSYAMEGKLNEALENFEASYALVQDANVMKEVVHVRSAISWSKGDDAMKLSAQSLEKKDFDEVIKQAEKARSFYDTKPRDNKRMAMANICLAAAHCGKGNLEAAIAFADGAVKLDPHSSEVKELSKIIRTNCEVSKVPNLTASAPAEHNKTTNSESQLTPELKARLDEAWAASEPQQSPTHPRTDRNRARRISVGQSSFVQGYVVKEVDDKYIIQTSLGFSIAEWYGGTTLSEGQEICGELNTIGFVDVAVAGSDSAHLWIEDYCLSESEAVDAFLRYK